MVHFALSSQGPASTNDNMLVSIGTYWFYNQTKRTPIKQDSLKSTNDKPVRVGWVIKPH
jgi:hypothetical protein